MQHLAQSPNLWLSERPFMPCSLHDAMLHLLQHLQKVYWQNLKKVRLELPVDGSRDYKIKIKGFPDVKVRNWKYWQPIEQMDTGVAE